MKGYHFVNGMRLDWDDEGREIMFSYWDGCDWVIMSRITSIDNPVHNKYDEAMKAVTYGAS